MTAHCFYPLVNEMIDFARCDTAFDRLSIKLDIRPYVQLSRSLVRVAVFTFNIILYIAPYGGAIIRFVINSRTTIAKDF